MAAVKSMVGKVMGLSDLTHATLAVGASSALIPLLPSLSPSHLAALHLSSLATGLGTQMYVSFVAGPTMFLHLPRHVFGDVQVMNNLKCSTSQNAIVSRRGYSPRWVWSQQEQACSPLPPMLRFSFKMQYKHRTKSSISS